jgi:hypothetical protein
MKKLILIFLLIACQLRVFASPNDIQIQFNKILKDLDSVITNSTNKHPAIEKNYKYVLDKIYQHKIAVKYDSTLSYSFLGCASANIIDTLNYSFVFGNFVIDAYKYFPYLIQGIIIHEFQHLYDFYTNRELIEISINNQIEKTYFEMDALTLEALFIKTYIGKRENLSPIEMYLLADIDNNLLGSATLFQKVDLGLLHRIDAIKDQNISFAQGKKKYIEIGEKLLQSTKFSDNAWENYCNVITLKTFTYYSRQVLHDLLSKLANQSLTDSQLDMNNYPDVLQIMTKIQDVLKTNNQYFGYYDDTMSMFDKYIKKKMNN